MSYQASVYDAVCNAGRLMKEGRAQAVKLEGGKEVFPQIEANHQSVHTGCGSFGTDPRALNVFGGSRCRENQKRQLKN